MQKSHTLGGLNVIKYVIFTKFHHRVMCYTVSCDRSSARLSEFSKFNNIRFSLKMFVYTHEKFFCVYK